jgi:hypothetical protein
MIVNAVDNIGQCSPKAQKAAQHSVHPTGGTRRVFRQFAWLGAGSGKVALSYPAHPRVTPTVGWLVIIKIDRSEHKSITLLLQLVGKSLKNVLCWCG